MPLFRFRMAIWLPMSQDTWSDAATRMSVEFNMTVLQNLPRACWFHVRRIAVPATTDKLGTVQCGGRKSEFTTNSFLYSHLVGTVSLGPESVPLERNS